MNHRAALAAASLLIVLLSRSASADDEQLASTPEAAQKTAMNSSLLFWADFNASPDAAWARGDTGIYTADSLKREKVTKGLHGKGVRWHPAGGREGGALEFTAKQDELVFFRGRGNVPNTSSAPFQGGVSLWLRLSPVGDLPQGYVDPLQITDKKWNDASFFLDFDQNAKRDFRLGAFSNHAF